MTLLKIGHEKIKGDPFKMRSIYRGPRAPLSTQLSDHKCLIELVCLIDLLQKHETKILRTKSATLIIPTFMNYIIWPIAHIARLLPYRLFNMNLV